MKNMKRKVLMLKIWGYVEADFLDFVFLKEV